MFLNACAAIALSAPGCAALSSRTRLAYAFVNDPPLTAYRPTLDALVATVLPFERSDFPPTASQVSSRLLNLFQLETDARFLAVQKMLLYFEETDLFPYVQPLMRDERVAADAMERGIDTAADVAGKEALDARLYSEFASHDTGASRRFSELALARRREYLALWQRSDFLMKRQFHASVRALVMIAAYSMDDVWTAIGYAGPMLPRTKA